MSYAEFFGADEALGVLVEGSVYWSAAGDRVEPIEFSERDRVDLLNTASPTLDTFRYRLRAVEDHDEEGPRDVLEILPVPTEHLWATAYYLPTLLLPQDLSGDVRYKGIKGLGEEWLILDVLISLKGKTDEQVTLWQRRRDEVLSQLLAQASDRDAAQPARIRQTWHRTDAGRPLDRGDLSRRYPWRGR